MKDDPMKSAQLPLRSSSAWGEGAVLDYLRESRNPMRLSVPSGDAPVIVALWYLIEGCDFLCASQADAFIVREIGRTIDASDNGCGFDVSDSTFPYRGVRGQGRVDLVPDKGADVLDQLIERYLDASNQELANWLRKRSGTEVAIRISPQWLTSWDFSARMK